MAVDHRVPPITGPKKRANETVDWARPFARPTTCGGDMAFCTVSLYLGFAQESGCKRVTHNKHHDRSVCQRTTAVPHSCHNRTHCSHQLMPLKLAYRSMRLTSHDENPSALVGTRKRPQQRQRKVTRQVHRTAQPKHLQVAEPTQRRAKTRVEPELIDELEQTHECDEDGEIGRVETDTARLVLPVHVS